MGSVSAALAYVAVRKAGPTVSVFVLINYALFFTLLINIYQGYVSPLHAFPWPKSTTPVMGWVLLVGISVLGSLAQVRICTFIHLSSLLIVVCNWRRQVLLLPCVF